MSLLNPSCPRARCVAPLTDPVPNASRVTLTPDLPSVTQSVAVPRAAVYNIAGLYKLFVIDSQSKKSAESQSLLRVGS